MSFRNLILATLLGVAGCTSMTVRPVDPAAKVQHVCIENNPKVMVGDFLPVIRDAFTRHGISTEVYPAQRPPECEYVLKYTALRSWDFAPYLSKAELHLERDGVEVASAEYHLKGKGGFALTKFQGTKTKMDPVVDALLKGY